MGHGLPQQLSIHELEIDLSPRASGCGCAGCTVRFRCCRSRDQVDFGHPLGHGREPARLDYERWTPHVAVGGTLVIHDVFPDPADGGRPPYEEIYLPALASGHFVETSATGSLRVLTRLASPSPEFSSAQVGVSPQE